MGARELPGVGGLLGSVRFGQERGGRFTSELRLPFPFFAIFTLEENGSLYYEYVSRKPGYLDDAYFRGAQFLFSVELRREARHFCSEMSYF